MPSGKVSDECFHPRRQSGPVGSGFPSCPSSPPSNHSAGCPLGVGLPARLCFHPQPPSLTQTAQEKHAHRRRKWGITRGSRVRPRVGAHGGFFFSVTRAVRGHALRAAAKDNTLKMEAGDDPPEGQVGGGGLRAGIGGPVEELRCWAGILQHDPQR